MQGLRTQILVPQVAHDGDASKKGPSDTNERDESNEDHGAFEDSDFMWASSELLQRRRTAWVATLGY